MGQTIAEKILSKKVGRTVYADEIIIAEVDGVMATDTTAPLTIKAFQAMGGKNVWDASKVSLIIDHAAPAPNERISNLHKMMREFAASQSCKLFDIGEGICHQVIVEHQLIRPGDLFIGADSHTPTGGALGAFACGMGSTDAGAILKTGKTWLKVPQSIRVECKGKLQDDVHPKDLVLFLTGQLTIAGATYKAVEFTGDTFHHMSLAGRMCVANMLAEMGAKTGFVETKGLDLPYAFEHIEADHDATYSETYSFDVSQLRPQIATPNLPDQVVNIDAHLGTSIDYAFIGTCGNGRLEDLQAAARVLEGRKVKEEVRFIIAPASRNVMLEAMLDGTAHTLVEAGASFITPGCGPCVGTHQGVPADGETVISAANRNFRGRMGNRNARIYLAAPATVAASAVAGKIATIAQLS